MELGVDGLNTQCYAEIYNETIFPRNIYYYFVYPQIFRPSKGTANIMRSACVPLVKKGLDSKWIDEMEWRQGRLLDLGIT